LLRLHLPLNDEV